MSRCENCGAPLAKPNARCTYCDVSYRPNAADTTQPMPRQKSIEAITMERDAKTYLTAARNSGYVFGITIILTIVLAIFGGYHKGSFGRSLTTIVLNTSFWAGIVMYIIGHVKRGKAKDMK